MAKDNKIGFNNFYLDVLEFMKNLRKEIGPNVMINFMLNENDLIIAVYFTKIPPLMKVEPYTVLLQYPDLLEPEANTTKVIVEDVKKYMEKNKKEIIEA